MSERPSVASLNMDMTKEHLSIEGLPSLKVWFELLPENLRIVVVFRHGHGLGLSLFLGVLLLVIAIFHDIHRRRCHVDARYALYDTHL